MWEASYPFFDWHTNSWLGTTVNDSIWLFPAIETVHILAMAIMLGGLLVLDLRLLGIGMTRQSMPMLAKTLMPFVNWGLVIMLLSGYGMFASGGLKYYSNDGFKFKMGVLAAVLVFQYTIYTRVVKQEDARRSKLFGGTTAMVSFALWFLVGAAGRAIGFV